MQGASSEASPVLVEEGNFDESIFETWQDVDVVETQPDAFRSTVKLLKPLGLISRRLQRRFFNNGQKLLIPLLPDVGIQQLPKHIFDDDSIKLTQMRIRRTYQDYSIHDALRRLLPKEMCVPTSFNKAGHIIRLRLRSELVPYGRLIGKVLLDKVPGVRTVVNVRRPVGECLYSIFDTHTLAGEEDTWIQMQEQTLKLEFDCKNIFFNSRLSAERYRLLCSTTAGDVVCDLAAGVGAFALLAARQNCFVFANDLNPASAQSVLHNATLNDLHIQQTFTGCARECMAKLRTWPNPTASVDKLRVHVVFKLPGKSLEFLDMFKHSLQMHRSELFSGSPMTLIVHFYCFAPVKNPRESVFERVQAALGYIPSSLTLRRARNISAGSDEFCVEFSEDLLASS